MLLPRADETEDLRYRENGVRAAPCASFTCPGTPPASCGPLRKRLTTTLDTDKLESRQLCRSNSVVSARTSFLRPRLPGLHMTSLDRAEESRSVRRSVAWFSRGCTQS